MSSGVASNVERLLAHMECNEARLWPVINAQHEFQAILMEIRNDVSVQGHQYVEVLDSIVGAMGEYEALVQQILPVQMRLRLKLVELGQLTNTVAPPLGICESVIYTEPVRTTQPNYHAEAPEDFWITLDSIKKHEDTIPELPAPVKVKKKRTPAPKVQKDSKVKNEPKGQRLVNKINREKGLEYQTTTGKIVPKKEFEYIECKCRLHCHLQINHNAQKKLFDEYYKFTWSQKTAFLLSHIELKNCEKRRKPAKRLNVSLKKQTSRVFFLNDIKYKRLQVCKTFFRGVLHISEGKIEKTLKKQQTDPEQCVEDLRGKHPFVRKTTAATQPA